MVPPSDIDCRSTRRGGPPGISTTCGGGVDAGTDPPDDAQAMNIGQNRTDRRILPSAIRVNGSVAEADQSSRKHRVVKSL
jgi:hypothetical protein